MIELIMAAGIAALVDPAIDNPYRALPDTCAVVADIDPSRAEWCEGADQISSGLGYQIETGGFRFWLSEGDFWENSYISNWGYSFPFSDSSLRTARIMLQLVCVDSASGDIRSNGPSKVLIANHPDLPNVPGVEDRAGGSVTLSTSGPCNVGEQREVFTAAVVSDNDEPWWQPGDLPVADETTVGWVDGANALPGYLFEVLSSPDYGQNGGTGQMRVHITQCLDHTNFWEYTDCFNETYDELSMLIRRTDDSTTGSYSIFAGRFWVTASGASGSVSPYVDLQLNAPASGLGFGSVRVYSHENPLLPERIYYPEGYEDRFEGDDDLPTTYVLGTLTRYGAVNDIEWSPEAQPITAETVPGVCDDVGDCIDRCTDWEGSWNPTAWWDELRDFIVCLIVPEVDVTEMSGAMRTDVGQSLMMQSTSFYLSRAENLAAIPAYMAVNCGTLIEFGDDGVWTQEISTCDIPAETRERVRVAISAVIGFGALLALWSLALWALGLRSPGFLSKSGEGE